MGPSLGQLLSDREKKLSISLSCVADGLGALLSPVKPHRVNGCAWGPKFSTASYAKWNSSMVEQSAAAGRHPGPAADAHPRAVRRLRATSSPSPQLGAQQGRAACPSGAPHGSLLGLPPVESARLGG